MRGIRTIWQQWQIDYLTAHYADTSNDDLCRQLGIKYRTMRRMAVKLRLEKSSEFITDCQHHAAQCAAFANRGEGNAGKCNLIKYGAKHRFKKGHPPLPPEREAERLRKANAKRNETIRRDYLRLSWGLDPKSKLVKHLKNKNK